MDLYPAHDMYEGFCNYQGALLREFDRLSVEYGFETVDASRDAKAVFASLQGRVLTVLEGSSGEGSLSQQIAERIERVIRAPQARAAAAGGATQAAGKGLELVPQHQAGSWPRANGNGQGAA